MRKNLLHLANARVTAERFCYSSLLTEAKGAKYTTLTTI